MNNKISKFPHKKIRHSLAWPFAICISLPIVIFDFFLEIYHRIVFPLYGIPVVERSKYIKIDRQKLMYLTFIDKLGCMYCGYVNGFAAYFVRIAGDTEKYWCGIMHKKDDGFIPQPHHKDFLPYDDEEAFKKFIKKK